MAWNGTHRTPTNLGTLQAISCSLCCAYVELRIMLRFGRYRHGDNTHISHEHHATVPYEIKECLNLAMFLEQATNVIAVRLVLETAQHQRWTRTRRSKRSGRRTDSTAETLKRAEWTLALILRMNNVRQGFSLWIRSSMIESWTLSSLSRRGPPRL